MGVIVFSTLEISGGIADKYGIYFGICRAGVESSGVRIPEKVRYFFFYKTVHTVPDVKLVFYPMGTGFFL
jgi:hypothetical protein